MYFGEEGDFNVMVLDLLGPCLEDLFNYCGRRFTLKTSLMVADQLISRIEYVQSKFFIHRDIKPDNFLIGLGNKTSLIHIIDFGLAKRYRDPKTMLHIPFSQNKNLTGTARYASVNAHMGYEQGRRDDLEGIGYVILYFIKGSLPWQGIAGVNKNEKYQKISQMKVNTSVEALCRGFPAEFHQYLKYCKELKFEQDPDYDRLRKMLKDLFVRSGLEYDYIFDWHLVNLNPSIKNPYLNKNEVNYIYKVVNSTKQIQKKKQDPKGVIMT